MPPEPRIVPRFAAEPAQEPLPYGRWADTLRVQLLTAVEALGEDLGEVGDVVWFPDRGYGGRTYVPATARTSTGLEVFGYVSYVTADEPGDFAAVADMTEETAESHPEWRVDLCDEVIGTWRGTDGASAQMTLVWGVPLVDGGAIATAELGGRVTVVVDQCPLLENRFTLIAPDDYRGDTLSVRVFDGRARELAVESLYED
jgi:hypothetical protein